MKYYLKRVLSYSTMITGRKYPMKPAIVMERRRNKHSKLKKKRIFVFFPEKESLFHNERNAASFFFYCKRKKRRRVVWAWREERCDCHPNLYLLFSPFRQKPILHFSLRPLILLFGFLFFCCCPIFWLREPGYSRESPIASIIKRIISYSARIPRRVTGTPPLSFADDVVNVTRVFMWILVFGFSFSCCFLKFRRIYSQTLHPKWRGKKRLQTNFFHFLLTVFSPFFFFSRRIL